MFSNTGFENVAIFGIVKQILTTPILYNKHKMPYRDMYIYSQDGAVQAFRFEACFDEENITIHTIHKDIPTNNILPHSLKKKKIKTAWSCPYHHEHRYKISALSCCWFEKLLQRSKQ